MKKQKIFCSACDQEVSVIMAEVPTIPDGHATLADSSVVCLEMGERCSGALCPVGAVSQEAMAVRIAKSGLRPDLHATVRAVCDGCQQPQDLMLTRGGYVTCPECGATRRMMRD